MPVSDRRRFRIPLAAAGLVGLPLLYLFFWPIAVTPRSWSPPANPGFTGEFAPGEAPLSGLPRTALRTSADGVRPADLAGPEDLAVAAAGRIYTGTEGGLILRLPPAREIAASASTGGSKITAPEAEVFARTGGRPLGLDFDAAGNLIVADGYRGLLSVDPAGQVRVLADRISSPRTDEEEAAILFADDLDIAADGRIYFSDASTKFGAEAYGGVTSASFLDIVEHGGHGRLLLYYPATEQTEVLLRNIDFANGVALAADDSYLLINETGSYRVLRYWLKGPRAGPDQQPEVWLDNLPGFPDNIERDRVHPDVFWVAMIAPRNALLDSLGESPFLRRMIPRLPALVRPRAVHYVHVLAVRGRPASAQGRIEYSLQDPAGALHANTSVHADATHLYFGSLRAREFMLVPRADLNLTL